MAGSWLDAYTLDILGEQNKDKIGQFQLWCVVKGIAPNYVQNTQIVYQSVVRRCSMSWGLGAFLMGFLTDLFGFAVNFTVYAVLSFSSIAIVAWKIPAQTRLEKSVKYAPAHITFM
jgi:hypothetical protein